jgi:hypothetical protein
MFVAYKVIPGFLISVEAGVVREKAAAPYFSDLNNNLSKKSIGK